MTTRRNLLKTAAAAAALPFAGQIGARELAPDQKWTHSTDVVVVGFGGAGASAAIAAKDAGADVIVLEKMPEAGGNTHASAGAFIVPDNADHAYEYLEKTFLYADNEMDPGTVRAFCDEAIKLKDYLKELNPQVEFRAIGRANFPNLPHASTITKYQVKGKYSNGGQNLFHMLEGLVKARNIPVFCGTPAVALVRKGERIVGVIARQGDKEIAVRAAKGVILTTGGYEYDKEFMQNFCQGNMIHGLGNPGNTGDGLRLAQSVGAQLWHMNSYSCPLGVPVPGLKAAVMVRPYLAGCIWVDRDGKRFANEIGLDHHAHLYAVNRFDALNHRYPAIPCWLVFDETARLSGQLVSPTFGYAAVSENYHWSKDCSEEIKSGLVMKAGSVEELAGVIGVPAENLKATLAKWNGDLETGDDKEFGRPREKKGRTVSAPIKNAPFYAIKLYPAMLNTQGGPRRNDKGQIINVFGKPIDGLYSAGELGSIWGTIYQGSSNVAECLVFGKIAGRNAALCKPW